MSNTKTLSKVFISMMAATILLGGFALASADNGNGRGGLFSQLTDDQKEELKDLREAGDFESIKDKLEEYGFDAPMKNQHHGEMNSEKISAVKSAIEAGDYDAFISATVDMEFGDKIDETTFDTMVRAHALMENGEYEEARALMSDIDINFPHKKSGKRMSQLKNISDEDKETMLKARKLRQAGDREGAKDLMHETFGERGGERDGDHFGERSGERNPDFESIGDHKERKGFFKRIGGWFKRG